MIENLIKEIANTQAFEPEDKLSLMIKKYDSSELAEENLDLVHAARKDDISYADFMRLAHERNNNK